MSVLFELRILLSFLMYVILSCRKNLLPVMAVLLVFVFNPITSSIKSHDQFLWVRFSQIPIKVSWDSLGNTNHIIFDENSTPRELFLYWFDYLILFDLQLRTDLFWYIILFRSFYLYNNIIRTMHFQNFASQNNVKIKSNKIRKI